MGCLEELDDRQRLCLGTRPNPAYLVNAKKITNPSNKANPVARTPNTPAARSPSSKYPPSGARRRTQGCRDHPRARSEDDRRSESPPHTDLPRSRLTMMPREPCEEMARRALPSDTRAAIGEPSRSQTFLRDDEVVKVLRRLVDVELHPADPPGERVAPGAVVIAHWGGAVCSDVRRLVRREHHGHRPIDATLAHLATVEVEGDGAALGEAPAVVRELHPDLVLTRRDRRLTVGLEPLQAEQVVAVGGFAFMQVEGEPTERSSLRQVTPFAPPSGTSNCAEIACDLFLSARTTFSVRRPIPSNSSCDRPRMSVGRPAMSGLNRSMRRSSSGRTLYLTASIRKRRGS